MTDADTIALPRAEFQELLALLQAIRREADRRAAVEVVELAQRAVGIAEGALKREG